MKKFVAIFLALAMCLSLCACKSFDGWKVEKQIKDLGQVTLGSLDAIAAAESAFAALTAEDQAQITNRDVLTEARSIYNVLYAENFIDAIGEVNLSSLDDIIAAEDAYNALPASDQARVRTYGVLIAARSAYDVAYVESLIDAIGEVSGESVPAILAAEEAFNALSPENQALLADNTTLADARAYFDRMEKGFGEWKNSSGSEPAVIVSSDGTCVVNGNEGQWEMYDLLQDLYDTFGEDFVKENKEQFAAEVEKNLCFTVTVGGQEQYRLWIYNLDKDPELHIEEKNEDGEFHYISKGLHK